MRVNPDQGLQFAQMLVQDEEPLANINQVMHPNVTASLSRDTLCYVYPYHPLKIQLHIYLHTFVQTYPSAPCGSLHLCYSRSASNAKNSMSQ